MSVLPSVRMGKLGSHWTDFHEILNLNFLRKYVEKIQVSLKSDKNLTEVCSENPNTHFTMDKYQYFSENIVVYRIMWKNVVQTDRSQMAI